MGLKDSADTANGLLVRQIAVHALDQIFEQGTNCEDALESHPQVGSLSVRDRGFLHAIVYAVLRHKGQIEAILRQFLSKPLPRKSGTAHLILVVGAGQLLFLGAPPHAVNDTSVRMAREDKNALHFSGLINAVLRRVSEQGAALLEKIDGSRVNTPDWLWKRWSSSFGADRAHSIATAHQIEPRLDLSVRQDPLDWAARLGAELLPTGSIRLPADHAPVEELPGFGEGAWWVQDAASALPVLLLGNVSGKTVLDLCAAPGGKTMQLCSGGAIVTAVDKSPTRVLRLQENLDRMNFAATVVVGEGWDAQGKGLFDAVLLDAPCSATGTIRRHPELPFIKAESIIAQMGIEQRELLSSAANCVAPGGLLIYCTCSLEPDEGERQIQAFLRRRPDFVNVPVLPGESGIEAHMINSQGFLRTLPFMAIGGSAGLDGFFAARLRRTVAA